MVSVLARPSACQPVGRSRWPVLLVLATTRTRLRAQRPQPLRQRQLERPRSQPLLWDDFGGRRRSLIKSLASCLRPLAILVARIRGRRTNPCAEGMAIRKQSKSSTIPRRSLTTICCSSSWVATSLLPRRCSTSPRSGITARNKGKRSREPWTQCPKGLSWMSMPRRIGTTQRSTTKSTTRKAAACSRWLRTACSHCPSQARSSGQSSVYASG
mmetsp:Transcript_36137/g.90942  ORF Transcript_36137/g.90942 Transcript_36137/m.90942 type:complete len:213 (+) Transcript_36137:197-835(+)